MSRRWLIALTGGIACGKSEVAGMLAAEGVPVLDTDQVARRLLSPGHWVFENVVAAFGSEYLAEEGGIDRRRLGALVFSNAEARERLNAIMHPAVYEEVFRWAAQAPASEAVVMIPLLYETKREKDFDRVWVVAADESLMLRRMAGRGWTEAEARARIAAQMSLQEKIKRADVVLWNNTDLSALRAATREAWNQFLAEKEKP
ncbi:MAG TPA: dephospho-CoA kinase [Kiritimatiellia bacterium]|nr:dephospho-CoA kinase [Kiritimatiellia bacterium]HMO97758.1 dephospho-CoA kinase [Kiritimatiellia bacterium]HMP95397.1 dephospho-CoA kinase [Kiritimatiellia bacterium]